MDSEKFDELLEALELKKDKKAEDGAVSEIPVEIKTHKAHPKTYYEKWMAGRHE